MNFLDKINMESKNNTLEFLIGLGFVNGSCGWGCCKGLVNYYSSSDGLYHNVITVYLRDEDIVATWHQEYNCGGETNYGSDWIQFKYSTNDIILEMINDLLPSNLD